MFGTVYEYYSSLTPHLPKNFYSIDVLQWEYYKANSGLAPFYEFTTQDHVVAFFKTHSGLPPSRPIQSHVDGYFSTLKYPKAFSDMVKNDVMVRYINSLPPEPIPTGAFTSSFEDTF